LLASAGGTDTASAILNRDFGGTGTPTKGGMQSITVGGINVYMTNNIPTANEGSPVAGFSGALVRNDPFAVDASVSGTSTNDGYSGIDFTKYKGVVFHTSGVGTVKLMDLAVESDYLVQNQGTLLVGKLACGHNYLRASACFGLHIA